MKYNVCKTNTSITESKTFRIKLHYKLPRLDFPRSLHFYSRILVVEWLFPFGQFLQIHRISSFLLLQYQLRSQDLIACPNIYIYIYIKSNPKNCSQMTEFVDQGRATEAIYVDFSKVFNSLPQYSCIQIGKL